MKYGLDPEDTRESLQVHKPGSNVIKSSAICLQVPTWSEVREHIPWDKKGGYGQHNRSWTTTEAVDEQGR